MENPGTFRGLSRWVVLIRGGGEMATGVAHRLARCHFRVCLTEVAQPQAVRRAVSFCEAIYEGEKTVEGITAMRVGLPEEIFPRWERGQIPLLIDPAAAIKDALQPDVLVDAILAKRNTGTDLRDAPLVIGLGPGFRAGQDVHLVVETQRGHDLGRVIERGEAEADTGVPAEIGGYSEERVLRSPADGPFTANKAIGDRVSSGEIVGWVAGFPVEAQISGVLRGLIREGIEVQSRMKLGDIDPRAQREACYTISDKARAIAGGVLEAILMRLGLS